MECLGALSADAADSNMRCAKRRFGAVTVSGGDELNARLLRIEKLLVQHDNRLREDESYILCTYFLPKDSALGAAMLQAFNQWQSKKPGNGSHPLGHVKLVLAATLLDQLINVKLQEEAVGKDALAKHADLKQHSQQFTTLASLEGEAHHCSCRLTKKEDKFLLKVQWSMGSSFVRLQPVIQDLLVHVLGGERQYGTAPKGNLVREIGKSVVGQGRLGGA